MKRNPIPESAKSELYKHYKPHFEKLMEVEDPNIQLMCRRCIEDKDFMMAWLSMGVTMAVECGSYGSMISDMARLSKIMQLLGGVEE